MQLMNTVFVILSLMMNKIDSELKIINSIFNFNLKKNKMSLKINSLILLNSMALNQNKLMNVFGLNENCSFSIIFLSGKNCEVS